MQLFYTPGPTKVTKQTLQQYFGDEDGNRNRLVLIDSQLPFQRPHRVIPSGFIPKPKKPGKRVNDLKRSF